MDAAMLDKNTNGGIEPNNFSSQEEDLRRLNDDLDSKLHLLQRFVFDECSKKEKKTDRKIEHQNESVTMGKRVMTNMFVISPPKSQSSTSFTSSPTTTFSSSSMEQIICSDKMNDDKGTCEDPNDTLVEAKSKSNSIGKETTLRVYKAKLNALQKKLDETISMKQEIETKYSEVQSKCKILQEDKKRMERELARLQSTIGRKADATTNIQNELQEVKIENSALKKEIVGLESALKEADTKSKNREIQLNRALENVNKIKNQMIEKSSEGRANSKNLKQNYDDLTKEVKDLRKQRNELLIGFKKQMKLIDVLKRQKIHVEASRLLDFTEKEFLKVLDWGSKIVQQKDDKLCEKL